MKKKVVVRQPMQPKYIYYLTEPVGKNFDPRFKPQLTPKEMLELGVFDGDYLQDSQKEFPKDWFVHAKLADKKPNPKLNYFGVHASQPWIVWKQKGWLHPDDPLGWFQWYCRYYLGRRHEDDDRQIKRWVAIRRHAVAVKNHCAPRDLTCRPRQRQALLHWAYDSRKM
jgi:hypothetical protein